MASDIGQPLRSEVSRRAAYHCEYCLIHEDDAGFPHEIDHIISRKHGGLSDPENRVTVQLLQMNAAEKLAERHLLQRLGVYPAH